MGKDNRVCYLCGKNYSYCPTCNEDIFKPSWYAMWCSESCKKVDGILAAHTVGQIKTSKAKSLLGEINIDFDKLLVSENTKEHLSSIINSDDENISMPTSYKADTHFTSNSNNRHGKSKKNKK